VARNAWMIRDQYPGSAPELLPQLRVLWREKYKAEVAKSRKARGY
jgi:hypothetical protein